MVKMTVGTALCSAWPGLCANPLRGQTWSNPWKMGMSLVQGLERRESWCELGCPDSLQLGWSRGLEPHSLFLLTLC